MRWIWIDRFLEFNSRESATARKNISLAEEHLHDHFPGFPVMPNSLIIEGLAQTAGLLVGEASNFDEKVILAKVSKAVFHCPAVPGDSLEYHAVINDLGDTGAQTSNTSHIVAPDGTRKLQAEVDIMFAYLRDEDRAKNMFEPKNFVFTLKLLGVFEVGRAADGTKLQEPPGLANMKQAADASELSGMAD